MKNQFTMKKVLSLSLVVLMGLLIFTAATPKKKKKAKVFKGKITYALTYEGDGLTDIEKSKLPKTVTEKVMGTMSCVEMVNGPLIITQIQRPDDHVEIVMIELMDKKGGLTKHDTSTVDTSAFYTTEIEYSEDTKEIALYDCKKAVVTFTPKEGADAEEQTLVVYYCPELGGAELNPDGHYKGIPGRLLEFYDVNPKITTKYTATEIKKGGVNELVDFYFHSDFKEFKTPEELDAYFRGE
jgi:hypothetical protein